MAVIEREIPRRSSDVPVGAPLAPQPKTSSNVPLATVSDNTDRRCTFTLMGYCPQLFELLLLTVTALGRIGHWVHE
jgi:hypothetical protein